MFSFKLTVFICVCFAAAVLAAPTTEVPVAPTEAAPPATTTTAPASPDASAAPAAPTTTTPGSTTTLPTASASAPEDSKPNGTTTSAMSVSASQDSANATTFTCYGRQIGYYADPELNCTVYHFCLQGDYNGEPVYQRISYLCLNETVFDQQALDCVQKNNITSPCKESSNFYDTSNQILRKAIINSNTTAQS